MEVADQVQLALGVLAPFVAVLCGAGASKLPKSKGLFDDFVAVDDEHLDAQLDPPSEPTFPVPEPSGDAPSSEETPLLGHEAGARRRGRANGRPMRNVVLAALGALGLVIHLALLVVFRQTAQRSNYESLLVALATITVWLYAFAQPLLASKPTPSYTLLAIYTCAFLAFIADELLALVPGKPDAIASEGLAALTVLLRVVRPSLCLVALAILLSMPLREPSDAVAPGPDETATLGQWLTFSFLSPLIARGREAPLEEADVWQLARNLRSRVLQRKFELVEGSSLMARLFKANARDLVVTAALMLLSATLQLAQPVLLSRILAVMESVQSHQTSPTLSPSPSSHDAWNATYYLRLVAADMGFAPRTTSAVHAVAGGNDGETTARSYRQTAYLLTAVAFVLQMFKGEIDLQAMYVGRRATVRAKSETISSIFAKALKRVDTSGSVGHHSEQEGEKGKGTKVETAGSSDMGKITSLVATDANRIGMFTEYYSQLVQTPLSVLLAASFLYTLMGWSAFAGYTAFLLAIPANHFIMKWQYKLVQRVMEMRDRRMRSMNEVIQAIKYIKFSAWEERWSQRVMEHRKRELRHVLKLKIALFLVNFVWNVVPILVACISLTTFTYVAGRELTVAIAFPALLTFQILTSELTTLPLLASWLQGVYASVQRIGEFLEEEEVPEYVTAHGRDAPLRVEDADTRIGCEGATFVWYTTTQTQDALLTQQLKAAADDALSKRRSWVQMLTWRRRQPIILPPDFVTAVSSQSIPYLFALRDVSVSFPRGAMSLIYGPTGSGKSSLLAAILGEMKCLEGTVYLPKFPTLVDPVSGMHETISFCAQQPWLEHQTVRENILFGTPYDQTRYNQVLSACALVQDLKILQNGDRTEIGDKGISLSGGQKARVALARAIYAYTKTVILDDVLSAVDTHTASSIINRCFLGPLMKDRTLILVTHHVHSVIDHCSYVVRMDHGAIDAQGTPMQLRASGHLSLSIQTPRSRLSDDDIGADTDDESEQDDDPADAHKLVESETKASGSVKYEIYLIYIRAAGFVVVGVLFGAILLQRAGDLGQKFWVKIWSESYQSQEGNPQAKPPFGFPSPRNDPLPYIMIYVGIQSFNALTSVIAQIPNIYGSLRASRKLYTRMLESVLRSPARWFDRTPAGRILNRFSKDIDIVDTGLADHVRLVGDQFFTFIMAIGTIAYGIPWFLPAAAFIGFLHYYYANGYIKTSRDLNRLESILRSPIISAFGELLIGVSTVRAFGHEQRFMRALYQRLDKCQAAFYYTWMTNYWLTFRFSFLGAVTFGCTTTLAISLDIRAGLAAIIITQSQIVLGAIYWGMHSYISAEQAFNGVERIAEYLDLPAEPPRIMDTRPAEGWPSREGGIGFENVVIKYAPNLDPVLKNVAFNIRPSEKIGLCGRTGSGKSTLALSLFRFVDPTEGRIVIDGVDITSIGVDDLRSQLTLISQDAVLFRGTVRDNLDPFHEYTDVQCMEVLRKVQLPVEEPGQGPVASLLPPSAVPSGSTSPGATTRSRLAVRLHSRVSEGGNNWSAGQRQLIAMARALLRKTRIVVLDESTASVDFDTDKKIQHTIREGFRDSIMLIIAHRLHTIIQCDRVMVLDAGRVVEFDTPAVLLEREGGAFRTMCEKSGSFAALRTAAGTR